MMDVRMTFGLLAVWLTLLAMVASTPLTSNNLHGSQNTASLPAADGIYRGRLNGPLEYHRTLSKYNIPIPKGLEATVARYNKMYASQLSTNGQSTYIYVYTYTGTTCWASQ
jgi:hypothetical protein